MKSDTKTTALAAPVIPDYETADGATRALLDQIIAEFDKTDPSAGETFGDEILDSRNELAETLLAEQEANMISSVRAPMQKAVDFLGNLNFQGLLEQRANAMAQKNSSPVTTFLPVAAKLLSLFSSAAGRVVENYATRFEHRRRNKAMAGLDDRIHNGIAQFVEIRGELERAEKVIPGIQARIYGLGTANAQIVKDLPLHIAAGAEILRVLI